ncbi:alpha/beta hydrolase [Brevibacterium sp. RIT 803]|uniref:alpha/beta hydrolase n=1 Tax=Brevibacterium sp. RIT 803 TaxID=2810210 RepID=UPI00194DE0ED|nr:alpha/beta hydrolase [Brevibacterium sp. RIT 803]MBM6588945.1 alpha/beta hydrolase [Brevibacterium sp. RIT 803]
MPVHPDAQKFLDLTAGAPPLDTQSADQNRADLTKAVPLTGDRQDLTKVENRVIAGIPVRIYIPFDGPSPSPAFLYFHGGGWTIGDLELADTTVRDIAAAAGAIGISVDYRLAPESPFPAALDDVLTVTKTVLSGESGLDVDTDRVAVAGDSAGGNLAAVVSQKLRGHQPRLIHQVLIYPATDLTTMETASHREFADEHFLTRRDLQYFYANYVGESDSSEPRLSPALQPDLTDLPAATVITGECDPLRDEGEAYALAMSEAGNSVTAVRFKGQVHPFVYIGGVIEDANVARRLIGSQLKQAFESSMADTTAL